LPQVEGESSAKRKFKAYPIGYFHIDIAAVRTAQGKLYLLLAIDRTSDVSKSSEASPHTSDLQSLDFRAPQIHN
jgi:hypothetical protein